MPRKSAVGLVLSQMIPVDPDGSQSTYIRSKRSVQTSENLRAYQTCVADELEGTNPGTRAEARQQFSEAANSCS